MKAFLTNTRRPSKPAILSRSMRGWPNAYVVDDPIRRLAANVLVQVTRHITIDVIAVINSSRSFPRSRWTQRRGPEVPQLCGRIVSAVDDVLQLVAVGKECFY